MTTEEFEHEAGLLRPMLVATAARMLGSDSRAEDAAQETLAKLWMMRGELRSPMAALARAVVRNLCVDSIRRRRAVTVPLSEEQRGMTVPDASDDVLEHVMAVVGRLPAAQQIVLRLTGASEASVRKTLSRARMAVRKHYIEGTDDEQ